MNSYYADALEAAVRELRDHVDATQEASMTRSEWQAVREKLNGQQER